MPQRACAIQKTAWPFGQSTPVSLALTQANGHVGQSAQLLGISRKTLWEKMKRLNLGSVKT